MAQVKPREKCPRCRSENRCMPEWAGLCGWCVAELCGWARSRYLAPSYGEESIRIAYEFMRECPLAKDAVKMKTLAIHQGGNEDVQAEDKA